MSDFINKIITIVLIFMMLVLAPLLISYKTDDMMAKRQMLNDVANFIDMVKDTGSLNEEHLDKLYIECNSYGLAVDVKVQRLIRTEVMKNGKSTTIYYTVEDIDSLESMNAGDVVKVTVEEVGISTGRMLIYNVLKMDEGKFKFSLAGTVG